MTSSSHSDPGVQQDACLPQLIAWEVTRSCLLNCRHCRAAASRRVEANEFTTDECRKLLDNIAGFAKPIIILTGGEPMLRADIYDIARYAHGLGLPVVMAPCGVLLNDETARKIVDSGIRRISLSLDGATAATHDGFRGYPGSFDAVMNGIQAARRNGLDFQINTTISQHNVAELPAIMELVIGLGASVFNPFLLVPTGRGKELAAWELSAQQYEETLHWLAEQNRHGRIPIRVTCAPHYQRIVRTSGIGATGVPPVSSADNRHGQDARATHGRDGRATGHPSTAGQTKGCMGGKGFAFISHVGRVQICGFLETECGDIRAANYDFQRIWRTSPVFLAMRDVDHYHGRCGYCEFRTVCGGCRARAFALTGDPLAEEPFCAYQPRARAAR